MPYSTVSDGWSPSASTGGGGGGAGLVENPALMFGGIALTLASGLLPDSMFGQTGSEFLEDFSPTRGLKDVSEAISVSTLRSMRRRVNYSSVVGSTVRKNTQSAMGKARAGGAAGSNFTISSRRYLRNKLNSGLRYMEGMARQKENMERLGNAVRPLVAGVKKTSIAASHMTTQAKMNMRSGIHEATLVQRSHDETRQGVGQLMGMAGGTAIGFAMGSPWSGMALGQTAGKAFSGGGDLGAIVPEAVDMIKGRKQAIVDRDDSIVKATGDAPQYNVSKEYQALLDTLTKYNVSGSDRDMDNLMQLMQGGVDLPKINADPALKRRMKAAGEQGLWSSPILWP